MMKRLNRKSIQILKDKLEIAQTLLSIFTGFEENNLEQVLEWRVDPDDLENYRQLIGCLQRSVKEIENAIDRANSFSWNDK